MASTGMLVDHVTPAGQAVLHAERTEVDNACGSELLGLEEDERPGQVERELDGIC